MQADEQIDYALELLQQGNIGAACTLLEQAGTPIAREWLAEINGEYQTAPTSELICHICSRSVGLHTVKCDERARKNCPFDILKTKGLLHKNITLYNAHTGELWQRKAVLGLARGQRTVFALSPFNMAFDLPHRPRYPLSITAFSMGADFNLSSLILNTLIGMLALENLEVWLAPVDEGEGRYLVHLLVKSLRPVRVQGWLEQTIVEQIERWHESSSADDWPQGAPIALFVQQLQKVFSAEQLQEELLNDAILRRIDIHDAAQMADERETLLAIHSQLWEEQPNFIRSLEEKITRGINLST